MPAVIFFSLPFVFSHLSYKHRKRSDRRCIFYHRANESQNLRLARYDISASHFFYFHPPQSPTSSLILKEFSFCNCAKLPSLLMIRTYQPLARRRDLVKHRCIICTSIDYCSVSQSIATSISKAYKYSVFYEAVLFPGCVIN